MEILSVTLTNFKSHSEQQFVFQPGTNAICGENGAGKTSILEAIAWTLFNYKGAYRNEDLIRNGASSAQVTVSFISNRDQRTYDVQRCTTRGYTIYDPQLGQRLDYRHIEDEVMPWLRQHFGVAPGTDLGRLFANTIGVPQGTFTADFLQPAEKRKPIFDAILKVEEYRQAYQQMLSLEKYGKAEVQRLEDAIAQYEDALQDWELLQQRRQGLASEIAADEATLQALQADLANLQAEKDQLTAVARQVQQLEVTFKSLSSQIDGKRQANLLLEQAVQRSRQAVQSYDTHRESYQAFLQAEEALKDLDHRRDRQQKVMRQRDAKQKLLAERQTELTRLMLQLERFASSTAELDQLKPLIQQQERVEQNQLVVVERLQQFQSDRLEQRNLSRQFDKLQTELEKLVADIARIETLESAVLNLVSLEQQRDRLQQQLSRIQAAKQFETDLQQLVISGEDKRDRHQAKVDEALVILRQVQQSVPLIASDSVEAAIAAIQAGVDLNTDLLRTLHSILTDLADQTSVPHLQQQLHVTQKQLDLAYQQRAEYATLAAKKALQTQLEDDLKQLQTQLKQVQQRLNQEAEVLHERSQLAEALRQLGDPRGRSQLLLRELEQHATIQAKFQDLQAAQAVIQQEILSLEQALLDFSDLEAATQQQKRSRQTHQPGYLAYLQSQKDAEQLPGLEQDLQTALVQLQQLELERTTVHHELQQVSQSYDPEHWQRVEAAYSAVRSQADQITGGLPQQYKRLQELEERLTALQAIAEKRDRAKEELKQRDQVRKFISFARKAYKEAGPRITEQYVQSISREADRLFRELLNRQNVALEWTRDYEILVKEGAHSRRFINLSGGEQMCAALAVRLALLRILADIDIAFFDEPTTNMDRARRESLADAIANIKTFRQLFVISHDDTFEKVTENVILVQRE